MLSEDETLGPRIEALESTTFYGKRLMRKLIALMQETVALFPKDGRRELVRTLCENFNWHTPSGTFREQFCLRVLEALEDLGILALPARRDRGGRRSPPVRTATRLMTSVIDQKINGDDGAEGRRPRKRVSFKSAIAAVFRNLEALTLTQADAVAETIARMVENIASFWQSERSGCSYPRISFKPKSKWSRKGKVARAR